MFNRQRTVGSVVTGPGRGFLDRVADDEGYDLTPRCVRKCPACPNSFPAGFLDLSVALFCYNKDLHSLDLFRVK